MPPPRALRVLSALAALLAATTTAHDTAYTLHHRVYHPALPALPYSQRGSILIESDNSASLHPSQSLSEHFATFSDSLKDLDGQADSVYYQLALQRGDEPQSSWDFTSVKACHLPQVTSQTIHIHVHDTKPFAVDYFLSPIPLDGSCPNQGSKSKQISDFTQGLNTTVLLKYPHTPPLPELRKPQPLTPAGQPIQPVAEKSFIQKYWMYMAAIFIALVLAGGGEEEGPRRQAQAQA